MSKRSGLSRWEDLKRKFVDVGRHRYILHKIDMESWRDKTCPVCHKGFMKEPQFYFNSYGIHDECSFTPAYDMWVQGEYDKYAEE